MKFLFVLLSLLALCLETLQLSGIVVHGRRDPKDPDHCYYYGHLLKEGHNQLLGSCGLIDCNKGLPTIWSCPPRKRKGCKEDPVKNFPECCCTIKRYE